ncbi:MAG TPA: MYXO-CTERM sorting domain-containing protein, partial [Polyangiaceae bacterium]|nr:MYXO-CTERM sorting domain-containing protein [Polyangiaceae bacterium]
GTGGAGATGGSGGTEVGGAAGAPTGGPGGAPTGGSGGAATGGSGGSSTGGKPSVYSEPEDSSCGCSVPGHSSSPKGLLLSLGLLAWWTRRKRSRSLRNP